MTHVTLYSRAGCHLCEEMASVVRRVARRVPLTVEEIDIGAHPELGRRYAPEIPVLLINGRKAAKFRITEDELVRKLGAR